MLFRSLRAAGELDVPARALGEIIGVSEATISRLKSGSAALETGSKPYELALLFLRLFRSLDAIIGGDAGTARQWLRHENSALGGVPLILIRRITGLVDVVAYLDSRRALI